MKINEQQVKTYTIAAVAILIVYVLFKVARGLGDTTTGIFEGLGISETKEEKEAKKKTDKALEDFKKESLLTSKPTRTAAQWQLVANDIYNALKSSAVSDDKARAYTLLASILTDADMSLVLSGFGRRQEYSFGVPIGPEKTLQEFVSSNLNQTDINDLNKLYSRSKMKFKF